MVWENRRTAESACGFYIVDRLMGVERVDWIFGLPVKLQRRRGNRRRAWARFGPEVAWPLFLGVGTGAMRACEAFFLEVGSSEFCREMTIHTAGGVIFTPTISPFVVTYLLLNPFNLSN